MDDTLRNPRMVSSPDLYIHRHRRQPTTNVTLARDATPSQTVKRLFDTTSEIEPFPTKRARLAGTAACLPAPGEDPDRTDESALHQTAHPQRPEFVDPLVPEWLESVGSDRVRKRSRSDSQLHFHVDAISRRPAKSAPELNPTQNVQGLLVSPAPSSPQAGVPVDLSSQCSTKSLVEDRTYRSFNLAANNIYLRPLREQYPDHIADLVNHVSRDRNSPCSSIEEVRQDAELNRLWLDGPQAMVQTYFRDRIFPTRSEGAVLGLSQRLPMGRHAVPTTGSQWKVSHPAPDMLYGYTFPDAFPRRHAQLISMGRDVTVTDQGNPLLYPFFSIEVKGDGGSLWVATNQCLGASASCVNMAERLNHQLARRKSDKARPINSAALSVAMTNSEARLYITCVDDFLLHDPARYLAFHTYVRNIIDWGVGERLGEIRSALAALSEERRSSVTSSKRAHPSLHIEVLTRIVTQVRAARMVDAALLCTPTLPTLSDPDQGPP
ncbi:uncharacterized protein F5Z01DRAFT_637776 [Emericellopsis atlantica]|uniref:DUF7924 domain-containing protein n=1 Tax=Emericellopsis atlantica TaxID=2614577 RepID=A0A9P7ZK86_9HYPO|nr:uncharacterized protein F5Z01DRAFT_637776 [Emericellopsis atlantica]KAG9253023.1 hypothetical protein F5Z01DRAFT_637776 [Emericellopsis atlantica]